MAIILDGTTGITTPGLINTGSETVVNLSTTGTTTLGDASGDALTINSSAVSIPNGLNFGSNNLVLSSGNVGIGTSSPEAPLTIVNSVGNVLRIGSNQTLNTFKYSVIKNIAYNNNSGGVQLIGGKSDSSYSEVSIGGGVDGSYAATQLIFYTAANTTTADGSERMRIASNGNVGIGTNNPIFKLDVVESIRLGNSSNVPVLYLNNTSAGNWKSELTFQQSGTAKWSMGVDIAASGNNNFYWYDSVAGIERLRIDSSGQLLIAYGNQYYGMNQYTYKKMMQFFYPPSGQFGFNTDCTDFSTPGNGSNLVQMRVTQLGDVGCRGSFSGGQTLNDYAEYFEWSDSNPLNEDRIGQTVVLDNGKVRPSTSEDAPHTIIGVVSATAGVVLGSAPFEWSGKYKRDEFGRILMQPETWINWTDESGNHNYKQGEVPSDVVVPETAEVRTYQKEVLSDNYDESVDYTNREARPEWACIGLVGQVHVKKGQVVGDRWIKMKDVSNNVEMWFIR